MSLLSLGIDIAQQTFQVSLRQAGRIQRQEFRNQPDGFARLSAWLVAHGAPQVHACLEATGRYGEALAAYLYQAGHTVSVVKPSRIKAYAKSKLSRNKTDRVDADLIAEFGETQQPRAWAPQTPEVRELQALVRHLDAVQAMRQQEANRLQSGSPSAAVVALVQQHLDFLDQQIEQLKQQLQDQIDQQPGLRADYALLLSIPGIGALTAAKLLAENLLQFEDARAVAAYAGLSPMNQTSGTSVHRRPKLAKIGNAALRKSLYMPALSALRWNPIVQHFGARLALAGKHKMAIIGAAMHKLLTLAYGVLKSRKAFDPNYLAKLQVTP